MLEARAPHILDNPNGALLFTPRTPVFADVAKAYGAILHYELDEAAGSTSAAESVAGVYPGAQSGGVTFGAAGAFPALGTSVSLDGVNDFLLMRSWTGLVDENAYVPTASIGCAFKLTGAPTGVLMLFSDQASPGTTGLRLGFTAGVPYAKIENNNAVTHTAAGSVAVTEGYLLATFDGDTLRLYHNGSLLASAAVTPWGFGPYSLGTGLAIGCNDTDGSPSSYLAAKAQQASVWPYALDSSQASTLYSFASGGLSSSYRFKLSDAPVTAIDGRRESDPFPMQDGGRLGDAYGDFRVVTYSGEIIDSSGDDLLQYARQVLRGRINRLMRNEGTMRWKPVGSPTSTYPNGYPGLCWRSVTRHEPPQPLRGNPHHGPFQFSIITGDVPMYGQAVKQYDFAVYAAGGVREFSSVVGLREPVVEAAGSGATATIVNEGDTDSAPVWRIKGPADSIRITNVTTGDVLEIDDIDLSGDEYITVDVAAREVYLGDTLTEESDRYENVRSGSVLLTLAPGENEINCIGENVSSSFDPKTTVRCTWSSAWMP